MAGDQFVTRSEAFERVSKALRSQLSEHIKPAHSVSEVGLDPKITALVYVAARAPDAGEDYTALARNYPTPPATAGIVFNDEWGQLSENAFLAAARLLSITQSSGS